MDFKKTIILLVSLAWVSFGCNTTGGVFDNVDEDEPIRTYVETQWSKEDQESMLERLEKMEHGFSEEVKHQFSKLELNKLFRDSLDQQAKVEIEEEVLLEEISLKDLPLRVEPDSKPAPKPPKKPAKAAVQPKEPTVQNIQLDEKIAYIVQVGVFRKQENSQSLIESLKERGYDASEMPVEEFDGKKSFAVRIGQFKEPKKAEQVAQRFADKEGYNAVILRDIYVHKIIKPQLQANKQNPMDPWSGPIQPKQFMTKTQERRFSFQVGGLFGKEKAYLLAEELRQRGYRPTLMQTKDIHSKDLWYTLRIGWYYSQEQAGAAAVRFEERELMPTGRVH